MNEEYMRTHKSYVPISVNKIDMSKYNKSYSQNEGLSGVVIIG
jgi:hypothetical protein